jgi:hypothetical protein
MRSFILAVVSAGVFSSTVCPRNVPLFQQIETHFKWGEYDSIIAKAEPVIHDPTAIANSKDRADLSKFLGIAYAAQGRITEARTQFRKAFLSDSLVRLDSLYVSKTIELIFRTTIDDCKNKAADSTLHDSLLAQKKIAAAEVKRAIEKEKSVTARHAALAVSGVCFAAFLATGAGAVYEYYSTSRAYSTFRLAASQGDLASYNRYKTIVRNGDIRTVGYLAVSCVFGICSGYFFSRHTKLSMHVHSSSTPFSSDNRMALEYDF